MTLPTARILAMQRWGVSSIVVTHQLRDAFFVATRMAIREQGKIRVVPASPDKLAETTFIMLREGLICFEGDAKELKQSQNDYIRNFLS